MLAPLRPGTHKLHFHGKINIPSTPTPPLPVQPEIFIEDIHYTITVRGD
jgi:hypothetical protein